MRQIFGVYCQILARQEEILQKTSKNISLKYTNEQRLNCRCQELDLTYLTVSLVPTWWIFTPPSEFLPHLENFIPNPKNVRNTITIANTNILVGRKILPPSEVLPPKNYPPPKMFRLKARQLLSRLVKNIRLYFKRRHLIIYKYFW